VLAALTVSGLPSDRFLFAGFPPAAAAARRRWLEDLAGIPATLILYESPKRVQGLLRELRDSLGADRLAAICRELTKRFEEVSRGTLAELAAVFAERTVKGEIVIVIERAGVVAADPAEVEARLREALRCHSIRDAAAEVSAALGLPRRQVYQTALRLADGG
jgi:16S rRNA (cytidine1402-2'-O)-methyltransferase